MPLFALGSNGLGQLGIGHQDDVSRPTICVFASELPAATRRPLRIAAGGNHSLVATSPEDVFVSGYSADGRCGATNPSKDDAKKDSGFTSYHICKLDIPKTPSCEISGLCSATWEASTFVSPNGKTVYTCGSGNKGELGQGSGVTRSLQPAPIMDLSSSDTHVVSIAGSMSHTVVVLSNGDVYGWGVGRKGQLGSPNQESWAPRKIPDIPFKAVQAVCGREFTYVVSSPEDGRHMILGSDKWGVRSSAPAAVPSWKEIGSSWGGVYVLFQSGELLGWGRNDHGQLPPPNLPSIVSFAAGSEHLAALTKDGKVLSWGWGEHGNCGEPIDENGNVSGRWNELAVPGSPTQVWCGCATTWIYADEKS